MHHDRRLGPAHAALQMPRERVGEGLQRLGPVGLLDIDGAEVEVGLGLPRPLLDALLEPPHRLLDVPAIQQLERRHVLLVRVRVRVRVGVS